MKRAFGIIIILLVIFFGYSFMSDTQQGASDLARQLAAKSQEIGQAVGKSAVEVMDKTMDGAAGVAEQAQQAAGEISDAASQAATDASEMAKGIGDAAKSEIDQALGTESDTTGDTQEAPEMPEMDANKDAMGQEMRARFDIGKTASGSEESALSSKLIGDDKAIIYFPFRSTDLTSTASTILGSMAAAFEDSPDKTVSIVGYSDGKGSEPANQRTSLARAMAVSEFLQSKGISGDSISTAGAGSASPIASNDTEQGRRENRRVEVTIQ